MILDALKTLSYNRLTKIGFILFGTVLAPFMFIFQFAPHIFQQNSFVPLVLISACVGLPFALALFVLRVWEDAGMDPVDPKERLTTRFSQMATTSLAAGVGFYLPCCVKFIKTSLVLREAMMYTLFFLGAIVISTILSISRGGTKGLHERMQKYLEEKQKSKTDTK